MEFEQYLERDILTFLDSKIYKKENTNRDREEEYGLYLTKDYLKELNYALDNDELTRAKKLFDELKTNYSRLPKNSVERKKIYSLLEKMYEKIQNYVRIKEGKIEIIKQGDMEIFKDTTEKFSSIADRMEKLSTETTSDAKIDTTSLPIKRTELPIRVGAKSETKKDPSAENILLEKKKSHDENDNLESQKVMDIKTEPKEIEKNIITENTEKKREKNTTIDESRERNISEFPEIKSIEQKKDIEKQKEKRDAIHDQWKDEIIHKTTKHLERLKVHVVDKLLEELRKKLDEKSDEQNKKIESLRNEIVTQVMEELDKRLKKEKRAVSEKIELLRDEILDKVYQQAPQIISSTENYDSEKIYRPISQAMPHENQNPDSIVANDDQSTEYADITDIKGDVIKKYDNDIEEPENQTEIYVDKVQQDKDYSKDDLRAIYEQAIYFMFENRYDDAAQLFQKILEIQPTNKAAIIRLRECVEKRSNTNYSESKDPKEKAKKTLSEIEDLTENGKEIGSYEYVHEEPESHSFSEAIIDPINNFTQDIREITSDKDNDSVMLNQRDKGSDTTTFTGLEREDSDNKYSSEDIRVVYEQAIYYMSDNKYNEAARLFKKIINIQPTNKAAKIRLRECIEKQPTIAEVDDTMSDSDLETVVRQKPIDTDNEDQSNRQIIIEDIPNSPHINAKKESKKNKIKSENLNEPIESFEDQITEKITRQLNIRPKYSDEELQKMYEEAIYTMFQSNYVEAAKMFHQILRIRPENKAARIRLQECKEASGNA